MKSYIISIISLFAFSAVSNLQAQGDIVRSLHKNVPGQGVVTIHQDARIAAMVGKGSSVGEVKVQGYRVQVYAGGNSRNAKSEAERMAAKVRSYFPELTIHTSFNPPRWLCRVGDFRSVEEADAMMRRLRNTGSFKEVTIVKDQIVISY